MSKGHKDDSNKTIVELQQRSALVNGKNWLRHEGQAQRIDEKLLTGATIEDIATDLIRSGLFKKPISAAMKRVNRHIVHLSKEEHMLPVTCERNGVWHFDNSTTLPCSSYSSIADVQMVNDFGDDIKI